MKAAKAAFHAYVRSGESHGLREIEQKSMSVGSDTDGGYLVPEEVEQTIGQRLANISPIRSIWSVQADEQQRVQEAVHDVGSRDRMGRGDRGAHRDDVAGACRTVAPRWSFTATAVSDGDLAR